MIVANAPSLQAPSNPITAVGIGAVTAGMIVFAILGTFVAHAEYKRMKEHDWHVKEWHRIEEEQNRKKLAPSENRRIEA
jgi:Na+/glutamate symporter